MFVYSIVNIYACLNACAVLVTFGPVLVTFGCRNARARVVIALCAMDRQSRPKTLPSSFEDVTARTSSTLEITQAGRPAQGVTTTLPTSFPVHSLGGEWRCQTSIYVRVNDNTKVYVAVATVASVNYAAHIVRRLGPRLRAFVSVLSCEPRLCPLRCVCDTVI